MFVKPLIEKNICWWKNAKCTIQFNNIYFSLIWNIWRFLDVLYNDILKIIFVFTLEFLYFLKFFIISSILITFQSYWVLAACYTHTIIHYWVLKLVNVRRFRFLLKELFFVILFIIGFSRLRWSRREMITDIWRIHLVANFIIFIYSWVWSRL